MEKPSTEDVPHTMTYIGYAISMSPYAIQFSDNDERITMEQLSKYHDFQQGDKFTLYTDTQGKVCLKKER